MKRQSTAADDIRLDRKRFSISGSLLPLLLLSLLLVTQTSARSPTTNETAAATIKKVEISNQSVARLPQKSDAIYNDGGSVELAFNTDDEYADIDNVEWHHVKIVDGVMHEDHPIIMYKEDFVSEDYDPNQHASNSNSELPTNPSRRKYKYIKRQNHLKLTEKNAAEFKQEKYHALKPEKIYFDILPQSPVILTDDSSSNDSKFDPSRIRVEVISLLDEENDVAKSPTAPEDLSSKQILNKRPKKFHHRRMRRDLTALEAKSDEHTVHVLQKRTPGYIYERYGPNSFDDYNKHWVKKHPIAGKRWNGIDGDVPVEPIDFGTRIGGEFNPERVIWGVRKVVSSATTTRPSLPPLFHNSNPNDADFSAFNKPRPATPTRRPLPPLFHNSNPKDADFSAFTPARPSAMATTRLPATISSTSNNAVRRDNDAHISECVWAIINCCSTSNSNIRYSCFERMGCVGAFWNLNPCADEFKDTVISYVDRKVNKNDFDDY